MRTKALIAGALALAMAAAPTLAQAPNLAGSWTLVPDPNAAGGGGGRGGALLGQGAAVIQDAKTPQTYRKG